jgi:hypothetical protein
LTDEIRVEGGVYGGHLEITQGGGEETSKPLSVTGTIGKAMINARVKYFRVFPGKCLRIAKAGVKSNDCEVLSNHAIRGGVEEKWCVVDQKKTSGTYIRKEVMISIAGSFDSKYAVKQTRRPD